MKIDVILYLLIALFSFIIFQTLFPIREGMDDCMVVTLSDIKTQLADIQTKVSANSEDIAKIKSVQETPTEGEKEAYSKVSGGMSDLTNSVNSN